MKKQVILLLSVLSAVFSVSAADTEKNSTVLKTPKIFMGVTLVNPSTGQKVLENNRILYQSQPDRELCWIVKNITDLDKEVMVEEVFMSPPNGFFTKAISNKEGTKHNIVDKVSLANISQDAQIQKCWRFGKTDPIGSYSLTLTVNNMRFPVQQFELKK